MERILPGGSCLISSKDYPDAPNVPAPVPCPYCGANRYYLGMKLAGRIFWFPQPDDCDCPGAAAQRQQEQAERRPRPKRRSGGSGRNSGTSSSANQGCPSGFCAAPSPPSR